MSAARPRLAMVADYVEEGWPSMDLTAEMILRYLHADHADEIDATLVRPPFRRRFSTGDAGRGFTLDRLLNRLVDYPRYLRPRLGEFDVYHLADHSYGQLLYTIPPERTVVTCHDLDTFRSVLEPERERRSPLFRAMTRRVLDGFRLAAKVTCPSVATRDALVATGLVPAERIVVLPWGVDELFSPEPEPEADARVERWLGPKGEGQVELLHVSSTIPRKRIDVLLRVFAAVREEIPAARLVRAGGALTGEQEALARSLGVHEAIVTLPFLDTAALAAVYRRAALMLHPSEAEGFGFPVLEALASGIPVVASDLAAFRQAGGTAVTYCPVADVPAWRETLVALLREREREPARWADRRARGVARAASYSWAAVATKMMGLYREVLES